MPDIPYKQLKDENGDSFYPVCGASSFSDSVPISKGGTGATTAAGARDNLGVHEEFIAGDTITGQFFLSGYTQSGIKDCVLFLNTPKRIPQNITITATADNVNWVIAASGTLLQSGGTLRSVTRANEYQLNVTVQFANNFGGYYACLVPLTGLIITFS